jgi:hypothetical protein
MSARRKKRKKKQRGLGRDSSSPRPLGFDYGFLPTVAALSSISFPKLLTDASVIAIGYGEANDPDVGVVPAISLVGTNVENLIAAFQEFTAWAQATDGDALELNFVFLKSGGYLLALTPERRRLELRCLGYERTHRVISFFVSWVKQLDTVHPALLRIREYAQHFPAPFLFAASHLKGKPPFVGADPRMVEPVDVVKPLLKFDVTFTNEADARPGSAAWMALQAAIERSKKGKKAKSKSPVRTTPKEIFDFRARSLGIHFPVTMERISMDEELQKVHATLRENGFRQWQLDQATCNLVLSHQLVGQPHFRGIRQHNLSETVVNALNERYEMADLQALPSIATDMLRTQVTADGQALMKFLGLRARSEGLELLRELADNQVLDETANSYSASQSA